MAICGNFRNDYFSDENERNNLIKSYWRHVKQNTRHARIFEIELLRKRRVRGKPPPEETETPDDAN